MSPASLCATAPCFQPVLPHKDTLATPRLADTGCNLSGCHVSAEVGLLETQLVKPLPGLDAHTIIHNVQSFAAQG